MFCSSASVLVQTTSDFAEVSHMLGWMIGGLDAVRLVSVGYAAVPILAGCAVLIAYAPRAQRARGRARGRRVGRRRRRADQQRHLRGARRCSSGRAIAVAGPIGFIGLIVPHALRALIGPDHRVLLPASMFGGAVLLTVCDTLARTVIPLHHLPTGAVTAVLGGPFFVADPARPEAPRGDVGTRVSEIIRHVIDVDHAGQRRARRGRAAARRGRGAPMLERLAGLLGGAQHGDAARGRTRAIVVCAGDHGVGDPGSRARRRPSDRGRRERDRRRRRRARAGSRARVDPDRVVDAGAREGRRCPPTVVRARTRGHARPPASSRR